MAHSLFLIAAGFFLLAIGAELFVKGASTIARRLGVTPLLIGLTVVALGTSLPEVAITAMSAVKNTPSLALGNIVGSNIANLLMIGGCAAITGAITLNRTTLHFHAPTMVGITALVYLLGLNGYISRFEGVLLLLGFILYLTLTITIENNSFSERSDETTSPNPQSGIRYMIASGSLVGAGLLLLLVGSDWLVSGATELAKQWGVSDLVIGLTIVALGTSLPELATSVVATARGEGELALGNIIGSNISNLLLVLGIGATTSGSIEVNPNISTWDLPILLLVTVLSLLIFRSVRHIRRGTGFVLVFLYGVYLIHAALDSVESPYESVFSWMLTLLIVLLAFFFAVRMKYRLPTSSSDVTN
jgi:cation:H+ antiporter